MAKEVSWTVMGDRFNFSIHLQLTLCPIDHTSSGQFNTSSSTTASSIAAFKNSEWTAKLLDVLELYQGLTHDVISDVIISTNSIADKTIAPKKLLMGLRYIFLIYASIIFKRRFDPANHHRPSEFIAHREGLPQPRLPWWKQNSNCSVQLLT